VLPAGGTTVNPHSSTDATSGAGGIGAFTQYFGGNPNTAWLGGSGGVSLPVILLAAAVVYLLVRR
jgi:hypothetical protein